MADGNETMQTAKYLTMILFLGLAAPSAGHPALEPDAGPATAAPPASVYELALLAPSFITDPGGLADRATHSDVHAAPASDTICEGCGVDGDLPRLRETAPAPSATLLANISLVLLGLTWLGFNRRRLRAAGVVPRRGAGGR